MEITEKIKSFEDACSHLGIEAKLPSVEGLHPDHCKSVIAHYKLVVIASALNEGWKPDWSDYSQYKWFPWWRVKPSYAGFAFAYAYTTVSYASTIVGSRFGFKTEMLAQYAGNQFKALYEDLLLFN
jgi:hypothetical protein